MKIVIQCAATKSPDAGYMVNNDGRSVMFVADPTMAPVREGFVYAKPDDVAEDGIGWREHLLEYNKANSTNPLGLFPAYKLYANKAYVALVTKYGAENVYILSAGWGLIGAEFLTPMYDITFSSARNVDVYKRRRKKDKYDDLCLLPGEGRDDLVFLGGKDYLPLFNALTRSYKGTRHVFFNSARRPQLEGCRLIRFDTSTRTNWHYECVQALINETVGL